MLMLTAALAILTFQSSEETIKIVPWKTEMNIGQGTNEDGSRVYDIQLFVNKAITKTPSDPKVHLFAMMGISSVSSEQSSEIAASLAAKSLVVNSGASVHFSQIEKRAS